MRRTRELAALPRGRVRVSMFITLRDELNPLEVEGDILHALNTINIAAANGKAFCVLGDDESPVAVNIRNINTIRVADDAVFRG